MPQEVLHHVCEVFGEGLGDFNILGQAPSELEEGYQKPTEWSSFRSLFYSWLRMRYGLAIKWYGQDSQGVMGGLKLFLSRSGNPCRLQLDYIS